MRTGFFRSRLLALIVAAGALGGGQTVSLASGRVLRYSTNGNSTLVRIARQQVLLARDKTVEPGSPVADFKVLGEEANRIYVVTDSYPSRPGPMSYCQAGQEQFVRVLVRGKSLRQTFALKVASCLSNLELGSPGLTWDTRASTLSVNWLTGAHRYKVDERGSVSAIDSEK
ncbi:MAG TPA: hypothetical protein VGL97_02315 [Bryobacteraceae bacterium]|jgi:hypothetical protein